MFHYYGTSITNPIQRGHGVQLLLIVPICMLKNKIGWDQTCEDVPSMDYADNLEPTCTIGFFLCSQFSLVIDSIQKDPTRLGYIPKS